MNLLHKLTRLTGALVALPIAASIVLSPAAHAFSQGQIEGGDIYRIENVTQNLPFNKVQTANACDTLKYKVRLYNPDEVGIDNVTVQASLNSSPLTTLYSNLVASSTNASPPQTFDTSTLHLTSTQSVSYVSGSSQLLDINNNLIRGLSDGVINPAGIGIGSIGPSGVEYVQFEAKVSCPTTPPPTPVFSCDAFNITADVNRTVKISTFTTTATNGAEFKNAVVGWGDNSAPLTSANIVGQSHQYTKDGTYTVTATAHFKVNGQDVTAGGPNCAKSVTFSSTTPPKVTPPPVTPPVVVTPPVTPAAPATPAAPTALVNTGPGSVVGLFGATTAVGAVAYRWMLARRLSRQ